MAANSEVRVQHGTAACAADGQGYVARAMGTGSSATASGDGSEAFAVAGDNNTATAATDGCQAALGGNQTDSC